MKLENLQPTESDRLAALESKISEGKRTFIDVGMALCEIRDRKLYRAEHATFEEYCRVKWDFTRQYANQIIAGAAAVQSLPPGLETIVSNVGQARALSQVPSAERASVLKTARDAAHGRGVTAKDIHRAASSKKKVRPEIMRKFSTATTSASQARMWWYARSNPKKRGEFLSLLLSSIQKVEVKDRAQFRSVCERFLAENGI